MQHYMPHCIQRNPVNPENSVNSGSDKKVKMSTTVWLHAA